MLFSPLAFTCRLKTAASVSVGSPSRMLRPKRDLASPVFSSREAGNSHPVQIEHDNVRHAVRHTKPHATVTIDSREPGEIVAAQITAFAAKRLIANAFRDAA